MCLWCCILLSVVLLKSDLGEKITSDLTVMCSQAPVLFVSFPLKSRVFIGDLYNSVFHCVSFAKAENTLPCFCK